MAYIQNYLFMKYKDEYQKSNWTIECRIFISFIWSQSKLSKRYNDNIFTKKLIFATYIGMSRFPQPYLHLSLSYYSHSSPHTNVELQCDHLLAIWHHLEFPSNTTDTEVQTINSTTSIIDIYGLTLF